MSQHRPNLGRFGTNRKASNKRGWVPAVRAQSPRAHYLPWPIHRHGNFDLPPLKGSFKGDMGPNSGHIRLF